MSSIGPGIEERSEEGGTEDWAEGGCHCGDVRFRVRLRHRRLIRCSCSICTKKGFLGLIVPASDFRLDRGADALATYRFNTRAAEHRFCRTCGIHPFSRPRSHPDGFDVNARCLDLWPEATAGTAAGAAGDEGGRRFGEWEIQDFDGRNWEANVDTIR